MMQKFSFFSFTLSFSSSLSFPFSIHFSVYFDIGSVGRSVSIVRYHFRQHSYYPHSTLIMFDIEASVPTDSGDTMNSCAMPINFYCTIHFQLTFLMKKDTFSRKKNALYSKIFSLNRIKIKLKFKFGTIFEHDFNLKVYYKMHQRLNGS